MAQQNDGDMSTTFSTLNVNAMEFVPSFCTPATAPSSADDDNVLSEEPSPTNETAPAEQSSTTGTPTEDAVAAVAAILSETIDDKSPDNLGE